MKNAIFQEYSGAYKLPCIQCNLAITLTYQLNKWLKIFMRPPIRLTEYFNRDKKMASLAIEIMDSASGKMAEDVAVRVRKVVNDEWQELAEVKTNEKGQAVLVEKADIKDGGYFEVLVFLGAYFDQTGHSLPQFKMVDIVPLRFGVEAAQRSITLRVTATPHSYSADFSTEIKRLNLV